VVMGGRVDILVVVKIGGVLSKISVDLE
jgi:hypothetical protein